jgi:predicted house-cleaning NTP pyrophosphatase (Maf/HAM1 superfamily)
MRLILASQSEGRKKLLSFLKIPFDILPSTVDEDKIISSSPAETIKLRAKVKGEEVAARIQQSAISDQNKSTTDFKQLTTINDHPITSNDYLILSADSGAIINNQLLGKPKDYNDATRILNTLSDSTHTFITATYVIKMEKIFAQQDKILYADKKLLCKINKIWQFIDTSYVTFRKLTDEDIRRYLSQIDYKKYAGAYALFVGPGAKMPSLSGLLPEYYSGKIPNLKHPDPNLYISPNKFIEKIEGSLSNVIGLSLEKVIPVLQENHLLK